MTAHTCTDRPRLTLTDGIARKTATDEHDNHFVEFETDYFEFETDLFADYFAEQDDAECVCCGAFIASGWRCLDGGYAYCTDCVDVTDPAPIPHKGA